jgi:condensin-2 complex subunit H2
LDGAQGTQDSMDAHESLEDLCRSHLDALLASIAEAEQQTELDARVSTWKERIEHALEEQDRNPPFDIGSYGEQIIDTLSSRTENAGIASFSEIVSGKPKYEVARTFSALLQLVNGRSVDLDKGQTTNGLVCHTASNPFHVRLIGPNQRPEIEARFARKRVNSPSRNKGSGKPSPAQQKSPKKHGHKNGKVPVKTSIKLTPDGKRRRRSTQMLRPINLESS